MVMMLVSVLHQTKYFLSSADDGLPKRCCLPKKVGPCKASIPRYYYNKDTEQCEAFIMADARETGTISRRSSSVTACVMVSCYNLTN